MKVSDIRNDERIIQWFSLSELSEATRPSYTVFMQLYCECVGKTPTVLISEAMTEIKKGKLPAERKTVTYFAKYKECLTQRGYAPKSFGYGISVVKSFYKQFDIELSRLVSKNKKRSRLKENDNLLSKDNVIRLINFSASVRDRAIILLMASSGMAQKEVIHLTFKDIEYIDGIGVISVRRSKTEVDYITFCSPEACEAVKVYLAERKNDEALAAHMGPDDVIFVSYQGNNQGGYRGAPIRPRSFSKIFNALAVRLDMNNGRGWVLCSSHHLRSYFATTMENDGMPRAKVHVMLGHKSNDIDSAYFKDKSSESFKQLKQLYIDHVTAVSFRVKPTVTSLSNADRLAVEAIKEENEALKNDNLERDQNILEAKDEIKGLRDMLTKQSWEFAGVAAAAKENDRLHRRLMDVEKAISSDKIQKFENHIETMNKQMKTVLDMVTNLDIKRKETLAILTAPENKVLSKHKKESEI